MWNGISELASDKKGGERSEKETCRNDKSNPMVLDFSNKFEKQIEEELFPRWVNGEDFFRRLVCEVFQNFSVCLLCTTIFCSSAVRLARAVFESIPFLNMIFSEFELQFS
jgi:hypothetical protein